MAPGSLTAPTEVRLPPRLQAERFHVHVDEPEIVRPPPATPGPVPMAMLPTPEVQVRLDQPEAHAPPPLDAPGEVDVQIDSTSVWTPEDKRRRGPANGPA